MYHESSQDEKCYSSACTVTRDTTPLLLNVFDPTGPSSPRSLQTSYNDFFYAREELPDITPPSHHIRLVDINAQRPQVDLGLVNLRHQLLMRSRNIVEREDAEAESEEEVCAEGNEDPEGELHKLAK